MLAGAGPGRKTLSSHVSENAVVGNAAVESDEVWCGVAFEVEGVFDVVKIRWQTTQVLGRQTWEMAVAREAKGSSSENEAQVNGVAYGVYFVWILQRGAEEVAVGLQSLRRQVSCVKRR